MEVNLPKIIIANSKLLLQVQMLSGEKDEGNFFVWGEKKERINVSALPIHCLQLCHFYPGTHG